MSYDGWKTTPPDDDTPPMSDRPQPLNLPIALERWSKWFEARLDRIYQQSDESYSRQEMDLYEALGNRRG